MRSIQFQIYRPNDETLGFTHDISKIFPPFEMVETTSSLDTNDAKIAKMDQKRLVTLLRRNIRLRLPMTRRFVALDSLVGLDEVLLVPRFSSFLIALFWVTTVGTKGDFCTKKKISKIWSFFWSSSFFAAGISVSTIDHFACPFGPNEEKKKEKLLCLSNNNIVYF